MSADIPVVPFADAMLNKIQPDCIAEGLIRVCNQTPACHGGLLISLDRNGEECLVECKSQNTLC